MIALAPRTSRRLRLGRWGATALLALCFTLSYVDRQVMSLLVAPVKADLGLSDSQIGLLQGVAFSIFFVLASLPLAWVADRFDRARLAAGCIAVWSVMTLCCGLAQSFGQLMLARIGLAMAEAGLPPAALTLMADLHGRAGLARATSLFMLAPFVGGGLALLAGGGLYAALENTALPAGLAPWQALFLLAGVPGLLLAPIVLLFLADPRELAARPARQSGSGELRAFLIAEWRFCLPYMLALALTVMVLNAHIAWMPSAILRRFPVGEAGMGAGFGLVYLIAGSIGTLGTGWLLAHAPAPAMLRRSLSQIGLAAALLAPAAVIAPLAPNLPAMLLSAGIAVFCTSAVVAIGSIPFQLAAPTTLRAQMIALSGLVASLVGTGLGPLLVGIASDFAASAGFRHPLSAALATVGGVSAAAAALLAFIAGRAAAGIDGQRMAP